MDSSRHHRYQQEATRAPPMDEGGRLPRRRWADHVEGADPVLLNEERFRTLVLATSQIVWEAEADGRLMGDSPSWRRFTGQSWAEASGFGWLDAVHPDEREQISQRWAAALNSAQPYEAEHRLRRADGVWRWMHMRAVPLYRDDGSVREWIGTVADITERRDAEEALRAREERYRVLFNSVEEGFCIIEVIFNEQGEPVDHRYVEVNPAFERQSGMTGVTGQRVNALLPGFASKWHSFCGEVLRTGQNAQLVEQVEALGRWFEVSAVRLGGPGSRQVAILFSDITAAKRTEQELRQLATDLAESNRRQGEFLATLAHELRNPLAPIRSGLDLMRLCGANPAALERVRVMLERQVDHLVHLVDDLMDLARINSGKVELKKTLVNLNDILHRAVEISTPIMGAKDHALVQALPEEPLWLMADPHRLTQVVSNLLTNAAKYTPAQGQVWLAARRVGPWAQVEVTDTGIGIPQEALSHIFEMFTQVGHGLDHAQGGLGIGLNLVKRLVEGHGGNVSAHSEGAGRGSRFVVRLPLAEHAPDAIHIEQKAEGGAATGLRILIADDNADAVELLAQLLELKGHEVCIARDGQSALDAAREWPPDLALLDIGMPGMNGYELARAIRLTPGLGHVALAALTGWGGQEDRARSREAGFQHHLTKPINLHTLEGLLSTLAVPNDGGEDGAGMP